MTSVPPSGARDRSSSPFSSSREDLLTEYALANPKVGQRFSEMFNFWCYVVAVAGERITTLEGSPPVQFPDGATTREYASHDEFRARFAYEHIPGYWVRFVDDGNNVTGWLPPKPRAARKATAERSRAADAGDQQ